jgi:hypothetical protein
MRNARWWASQLGIALLFTMATGSAQAQATRTWVSGVGDDANPCSRTAPCKTFAGAISKTAAGGEISVLDPGGYGAVTITKSISIINDYSGEAGVLASGTNGITVNAGSLDVVILRGLVIDGAPPTIPGVNGIRFLAGASLHVEKCLIKNFISSASGAGNGILIAPSSGTSELYVANSTFINNGAPSGASSGAAIMVRPTGSGNATASVSHVEMQNNRVGFQANTTTTTGSVVAGLNYVTASGNPNNGISAVTNAAGGTAATIIVANSLVANNGAGVNSNGNAAVLRIGSSLFTGNSNAVLIQNGGALTSYKNNEIDGNGANNTPITGSALN